MSIQNSFTAEEEGNYRRKISEILQKIKDYRKGTPQPDYRLDDLEQAFKDLNNFYGLGKVQWFSQHNNIIKNYRFAQGLNQTWVKIASEFDRFWFDLTLPERLFVSKSTNGFYLPNLHGKSYDQFIDFLNDHIKPFIVTLDDDYGLDYQKQLDVYVLKILKISTTGLYTIICTPEKISVQINTGIVHKDVSVINDRLFSTIVEYLEL